MDAKIELLVIDDEEIVCKRLKTALEKNDYAVEVSCCGSDALALLREKTFDIVVSDVRIDDVDGLDVLRTVQETSERTKVILITGFATMEVAREALAKGAFEFLAKPFKPEDLRKIIAKAVKELEAAET